MAKSTAKVAADYGFELYSQYKPTAFDHNIDIDRAEWVVMPVGRNRDSGVLDEVNFKGFLEALGGEDDDVEVHRFKHWLCGWLEILIVNPSNEEKMQIAYGLAASLEDYGVLDEEALSAAQHEAAQEDWDNWGRREVEQALSRMIEGQEWEDTDADALADEWLTADVAENGLPSYESLSEGAKWDVAEEATRVFDDNTVDE
jgi:hypothetical protein